MGIIHETYSKLFFFQNQGRYRLMNYQPYVWHMQLVPAGDYWSMQDYFVPNTMAMKKGFK